MKMEIVQVTSQYQKKNRVTKKSGTYRKDKHKEIGWGIEKKNCGRD